MLKLIKDLIKLVCGVFIFLSSLYLGLLFIFTLLTIIASSNLLGVTVLVIILSTIAGTFYNLVDNL